MIALTMIKVDKQHHKIIRTSPTWGPWVYEYHERRCQIRKARELMGRPPSEYHTNVSSLSFGTVRTDTMNKELQIVRL